MYQFDDHRKFTCSLMITNTCKILANTEARSREAISELAFDDAFVISVYFIKHPKLMTPYQGFRT